MLIVSSVSVVLEDHSVLGFWVGSLIGTELFEQDIEARIAIDMHMDIPAFSEESFQDLLLKLGRHEPFAVVPVEMLTSKARAAEWAEKIKAGEFLGDGKEEPPTCTSHISICDELGNAVSCTHTLGTGAGVITPGLGFVYNNSMKLFDPQPGTSNSFVDPTLTWSIPSLTVGSFISLVITTTSDPVGGDTPISNTATITDQDQADQDPHGTSPSRKSSSAARSSDRRSRTWSIIT